MRVSYGATAHRAFALLFGPLIKEYKTAATYVIAQQIERNEEWKTIARACDDWPSMRRVLQKLGKGDESWLAISIHDIDINSRVLTMIIREKYNEADDQKKETKSTTNEGSGSSGG
jgi:hypothetical protein